MPVEDRRRAQLRAAASTSLGEEAADTLMELVTPAGQDAATRADVQGVLHALDHMDARWSERLTAMDARWSERLTAMDERWSQRLDAMDGRLDHMDERFEQRSETMEQRLTATFERGLREAITSQTRALVVSLLVAVVTIAGLAFAL